ncbi:hypothetical protein [Azospirillum endophyticum]
MRSLADLLTHVLADPALPPQRARDLASSLRRFGRIVGRDLAAIPASFDALRPLIASVHPAAHGLSLKRWQNIRSNVSTLLRHYGATAIHRRLACHLPEPWYSLRAAVTDPAMQRGLARFLRYCADHNIAPDAVSDATFTAFATSLTTGTLVAKPQRVERMARQQWNRAVALPGWPITPVPVTSNRDDYQLPLELLPASFAADLEAWMRRLSGADPLDEFGPAHPLRPSSLKTARGHVLRFAAAVVHAGEDPRALTTLATLVVPERFKIALLWLMTRRGGASPGLIEQAKCLLSVARHWVQAPKTDLERLNKLVAKLGSRRKGMTDKNRARLRAFDDPKHLLALLTLPERLMDKADRVAVPSRREALMAQSAVAIQILLLVPLRRLNLLRLDVHRHLCRSRSGRHAVVHLVIPAEETKTSQPIEAVLPEPLVRMIDHFMTRYRPLLTSDSNGLLFPGGNGGCKHITALTAQIERAVRDHTGLVVNPHLFRHLAGKLSQQFDPGNYELSRQLLGHRSTDTTVTYYTGQDTAAAVARYDASILERTRSLRGSVVGR